MSTATCTCDPKHLEIGGCDHDCPVHCSSSSSAATAAIIAAARPMLAQLKNPPGGRWVTDDQLRRRDRHLVMFTIALVALTISCFMALQYAPESVQIAVLVVCAISCASDVVRFLIRFVKRQLARR